MNHSLNLPFKKAKGFYICYTIAHVGGAAIVHSGIPLLNLTLVQTFSIEDNFMQNLPSANFA
jgi:hypothetical protein